MKRALLPLVLALGCTEAAPVEAPPAPPVVTPAVAVPPVQAGAVSLKLLGKHFDDAGIEVSGAPKMDAPAWAKPRGEPGVVILEDKPGGFRMELRAAPTLAETRAALQQAGAKLEQDEPALVVARTASGTAVFVEVEVSGVKLRCGAERTGSVETVLRACRSLR